MQRSFNLSSDQFNFAKEDDGIFAKYMDEGLTKDEKRVRHATRMFVKDTLPVKQNKHNYCQSNFTANVGDSRLQGLVEKDSVEEYTLHLWGEAYCHVTSVMGGVLPNEYFKLTLEDLHEVMMPFHSGECLVSSTAPHSKEDRLTFAFDKLRIMLGQLGSDLRFYFNKATLTLPNGDTSFKIVIGAKHPDHRLMTTVAVMGALKK